MSEINCVNCGTKLSAQQAGEPCPSCGSIDRNLAESDRIVALEKARVARDLARMHFEVEPGMKHVIRYTGCPSVEWVPTEPIKLLEVNQDTVPTGVMPLRFGPARASGITYPSTIVEVTPEEFEKIKANELRLPKGWDHPVELPKPSDRNGS